MRKIYIYLHNRKIGTLAVNFNIAPKIVFYVLILMSLVATFGFRFSSRHCAMFKILAHKFYNFAVVTKKSGEFHRQAPKVLLQRGLSPYFPHTTLRNNTNLLAAKMRPRYGCDCGLRRRIYVAALSGSCYKPFCDLKQNFKPDAIQIKLSPRLKVCEIL